MSQFSINAVEGPLYDAELKSRGAHFTQSSPYRSWQEDRGFTVERFVLKEHERPVLFFQIITAPLLAGRNQLYISHGPILLAKESSLELIREFKNFLIKIAKVRRAIFVRFDPQPNKPGLYNQIFRLAPVFAYHSTLTQPRHEWIMDISATEKDLFKTLPKNTRYSIRTAERRGAKAEIITENLNAHLDDFYQLMTETGSRNGFRLHPRSYYEKVFAATERSQAGFLVVVYFESKPLVINLITVFGYHALHVFGGSTNEYRDKLPSYLAHWQGFLESKRRGANNYSFGGISYGEDTKNSWENLTAFKKNFPGQIKDFGPLYDLPVSRLWYYLYILGKIVRR